MQHSGVVILKPEDHMQQLPAFAHPHLGPGGPGQGMTLSDSVNQHFEHFVTAAGGGQPGQGDQGQYDTSHLTAQGGYVQQPQQQVDGVLQQQQHNFDVQVRVS